MPPKEHATDFEKIINAGRERKKNEDLAARIFSRDSQRRSSAPIKANAGGSLASRVGVKKRVSSAARIPVGNPDNDWTHDLHHQPNNRRKGAPPQQQQQQPKPNSLAARIHAPGTAPAKSAPTRPSRASKLANAWTRTTASPAAAQQQINNVRGPASRYQKNQQQQQQQQQPPNGPGLTIRGLAGPYIVMAQNFAPGTTAADIESAMTPVGGLVSSCRLVKTHPIVIAEIVFENKEGADRVVQTFNNQTADGRTLNVYMRPGGNYIPSYRASESRAGAGANHVVLDGTLGFDDPMEMDAGYGGGGGNQNGGGLYSDTLVTNGTNGNNSNSHRRGRGFNNNNNRAGYGGGGR